MERQLTVQQQRKENWAYTFLEARYPAQRIKII